VGLIDFGKAGSSSGLLDVKAVKAMKVALLREELSKRGLDLSGLKADLAARLTAAVEQEASRARACAPRRPRETSFCRPDFFLPPGPERF
jgi:hypothetical protein